jgi:anthranilate synthase component II
MLLMIDNYDSFTYNLVQYLSELGERVAVYRNDKISISRIQQIKPKAIVISPGPGSPEDAGISNTVIHQFSGSIPILGVCLGHQCIGQVFGGKIVRAKKIMHGKTSQIFHNKKGIFQGLEYPFTATRYHSLLVDRKTFSNQLELTAWTKDREIMGLRHRKHKTFGVQFHPESILTPSGKKMLKNFLSIVKK